MKSESPFHTQRYWCAVASFEHVKLGVEGGFAQVCHGKRKPLERLNPGDGIVYYSPTEFFGSGPKCQKFTSIGLIKDNRVYPVEMMPGFNPYRRNVEYFDAICTSIHPLLSQLSFTSDRRNWGYRFQFGLFEITSGDFGLILSKMNPRMVR